MKRPGANLLAACATLALAAAPVCAYAQTPESGATPPAKAGEGEGAAAAAAAPAEEPGFWARPNLLGSIGGLRDVLADAGLTFTLQETAETFGNTTGGLNTGVTFDGALQMGLSLDTAKAFGWEGGKVYISALQLHGSGPTPNLAGSLQTVSNVEGTATTRLYDAYVEQQIGKASIRAGQFGADEEFMNSSYTPSDADNASDYANAMSVFVNSTFGWPGLPSNDLLAGGPAYPLPTPGARLKVQATDQLGLLLGVFNGNPAGTDAPGNPQVLNGSGTNWTLCCGVFGIAEAQYSINQGKDDPGLPGTYRLGAYYHTGFFADQRYDSYMNSLASPNTTGVPRYRITNYNVYLNADQMILQTGDSKSQGIGVFGRIMGTPDDRNEVSFYVNGGMTWKGPIAGRENDSLAIGAAWANISRRARNLDHDFQVYTDGPYPIRSYETVLEATYQAQLTGWWVLQPDLQYLINPGGGHDPNDPQRRLGNAFLLGLRTVVTF